jgi:hypothetical protein
MQAEIQIRSGSSSGIRNNWAVWAVIVAALVTDCVVICTQRFPPSLDYPAWIYEGRIVAEALLGHRIDGYTFNLYPVPNTLALVVLGLLELIFKPETAGKFFMVVDSGLFCIGSLYLFSATATDAGLRVAACITALFTFGYYFFEGTLNYSFGLGLLFLYSGYLIRRCESENSLESVVPAICLCIIFLTHLLPFLAAVAFTSFLLVFHHGFTAGVRHFLRTSWLSIALLFWYVVARVGSNSLERQTNPWSDWSIKSLETSFVCAFSGFFRFPPWEASQLLNRVGSLSDLVMCVAAASVLVGTVRTLLAGKEAEPTSRAMVATSLACVAFFIVSPVRFQEVFGPGGRFLIPAVWFALGQMLQSVKKGTHAMLAALLLVLCLQTLYLSSIVPIAGAGLSTIYEGLAQLPDSRACDYYEQSVSDSWPKAKLAIAARMPYVEPIVSELPYYFYLRDFTQTPPDYSTSIMRYKAGVPIMSTSSIFCSAKHYVPIRPQWRLPQKDE